MVLVLAVAACHNAPIDYPPPPLASLGIHEAPTYVARVLHPVLLLAHPRLGQPAIRIAGEPLDVGWIGGGGVEVEIDGAVVDTSPASCDADGVCHAALTTPALAPGLHEVCVASGTAHDCSVHALAIVDHRNDPVTVVHISDAHIGDDQSIDVFRRDLAAAAAESPDFAIFTGDAADTGLPAQRDAFRDAIAAAPFPIFVVTGNHDYDNRGIDGHLLEIGPELDMTFAYGGVRFIGLSSGQDIDDAASIAESAGPDETQFAWLGDVLAAPSQPTVFFLHHPIYNGLFATVGPATRDRLAALVTRDDALAVLAGHTHLSSAFDAEGNSRDLSLDAQDVDPARLPLHYTAARATYGDGGFAVFRFSAHHVDYRWVVPP
jgi:predicted phosphodiesterase